MNSELQDHDGNGIVGACSDSEPEPLLQKGALLELRDRDGAMLAKLLVENWDGASVYGEFRQLQSFEKYAPLFEEAIGAANHLELSEVDDLDHQIAALGFEVKTGFGAVVPVKFANYGRGRFSFQVK